MESLQSNVPRGWSGCVRPKPFKAEVSAEGEVYLNDRIRIFYSEHAKKKEKSLMFSKTLTCGDIKRKMVL